MTKKQKRTYTRRLLVSLQAEKVTFWLWLPLVLLLSQLATLRETSLRTTHLSLTSLGASPSLSLFLHGCEMALCLFVEEEGHPVLRPHLKDLLARHFDAAMSCLGLLLGQLLPQHLQLLHQVPLVARHRQALCVLRQLPRAHRHLLGLGLGLGLGVGLRRLLQLGRTAMEGQETQVGERKTTLERYRRCNEDSDNRLPSTNCQFELCC